MWWGRSTHLTPPFMHPHAPARIRTQRISSGATVSTSGWPYVSGTVASSFGTLLYKPPPPPTHAPTLNSSPLLSRAVKTRMLSPPPPPPAVRASRCRAFSFAASLGTSTTTSRPTPPPLLAECVPSALAPTATAPAAAASAADVSDSSRSSRLPHVGSRNSGLGPVSYGSFAHHARHACIICRHMYHPAYRPYFTPTPTSARLTRNPGGLGRQSVQGIGEEAQQRLQHAVVRQPRDGGVRAEVLQERRHLSVRVCVCVRDHKGRTACVYASAGSGWVVGAGLVVGESYVRRHFASI